MTLKKKIVSCHHLASPLKCCLNLALIVRRDAQAGKLSFQSIPKMHRTRKNLYLNVILLLDHHAFLL